jgi:hypothetical protein
MAINIQGGLYATCAYSTDKTTTYAPSQGDCATGTATNLGWNDFNLPSVLTYLQAQSALPTRLGGICNVVPTRRLQSDNSAQDGYGSDTYYPGIALVLSGPMTVSVKMTAVDAPAVSHVLPVKALA